MTIEEIIEGAVKLGIKLTNAEVGTEVCQCWADRVELAMARFEDGDMIETQKWIDQANIYAVQRRGSAPSISGPAAIAKTPRNA